mgnify:FL=1
MAKLNWNPWMGLDDLEEDMRREMRETALTGARLDNGYVWTPAADVVETARTFLVTVELPGVEREHVVVELRGQSLLIHGERRFEKDAAGCVYQILERSYGPFSRKFPLPKGVDRQGIEATFRNGLLLIAIPKKSPEKIRRRIPIS